MSDQLTLELIEKVERERRNIFLDYLAKHEIKPPEPNGDITQVQLEDMEEKIVSLKKDVELLQGRLYSSDPNYRRLSEAVVNYSIKLDRINVIGRLDMKARRKKMLVELDHISTILIQKIEQ